MDSRPVREPPVREYTPEDSSSAPTSSRRDHSGDRRRGGGRADSSPAAPSSSPDRVSSRTTTEKHRIKAQMFRLEAMAPVTARGKAAEKDTA